MSSNGWMGKQIYTHTMEYYLATKKSEYYYLLQCRWILKAICEVQKDSHNILYIICEKYEEMSSRDKFTDPESRLVMSRQE